MVGVARLLLLTLLACFLRRTVDESGQPQDSRDDSSTTADTQSPPDLSAVVLNELMADNDGAFEGEDGANPDWLELYNGGGATADLTGHALTDDWDDKDKAPLPDGTTIEAGEYLLMVADGSTDEGHLPFELNSQGDCLGLFDARGTVEDWYCYTAVAGNHAWARIPDGGKTWEATGWGTPGAANALLEERTAYPVGRGATWSYLDSGEDPGEAWTALGFDDSSWATGAAPLGYGDDQTTQVSYGPDSSDKHVTTWFRVHFELEEWHLAGAESVGLALRVDDGAVIWINGQELARDNMPEGAFTHDTLATTAIEGDAEGWETLFTMGTDALQQGDNVLAVEVHQADASSDDLTLDAALTLAWWGEVY